MNTLRTSQGRSFYTKNTRWPLGVLHTRPLRAMRPERPFASPLPSPSGSNRRVLSMAFSRTFGPGETAEGAEPGRCHSLPASPETVPPGPREPTGDLLAHGVWRPRSGRACARRADSIAAPRSAGEQSPFTFSAPGHPSSHSPWQKKNEAAWITADRLPP